MIHVRIFDSNVALIPTLGVTWANISALKSPYMKEKVWKRIQAKNSTKSKINRVA